MAVTDIRAKKGSSALMIFKTFPNFLISGRNPQAVTSEISMSNEVGNYRSITLLGKTLDQKSPSASRPKLTCISTLVDLNPSFSRMANVL